MSDVTYDAFVKAYNNFDYRPLKGEFLRKFYVDDFTKDTTDSIVKTVKISERFRKISTCAVAIKCRVGNVLSLTRLKQMN